MTEPKYFDIEELCIYQIAEEWEAETETALKVWLYRMAKGYAHNPSLDEPFNTINFYDGQLNYRGKCPLLIQEKETACLDGTIYRNEKEIMAAISELNSLATECPDFFIEPEFEVYREELKANGEVSKQTFKTSLRQILHPIRVRKDHFRAWCLSAGYPLPRFWFGAEADSDIQTSSAPPTTPAAGSAAPDATSEENHGKQLAEQRHAPTRPTTTAINEVVGIIRDKEKRGEPWHHLTEIDTWLQRNPTSKASRNQFKNMVKESLHNVGITPANGRPLKK